MCDKRIDSSGNRGITMKIADKAKGLKIEQVRALFLSYMGYAAKRRSKKAMVLAMETRESFTARQIAKEDAMGNPQPW
jgi:hypothetical protein